nr:hypothetical protein [Escherichia coli]
IGYLNSITAKSLVHQAILFAILRPGSAQNPHVLRVRSGFSALSGLKLPSTITPGGPGSKERLWISRHYALNKSNWLLL